MPEIRFVVRWPDKTVEACYSPSLVVRDYFTAGESYALADFVERSRAALTIASERVREKYGFACSNALAQLAAIDRRAAGFLAHDAPHVIVEGFEPG